MKTKTMISKRNDELRNMTLREAVRFALKIHEVYAKFPKGRPIPGGREWHEIWCEKYEQILMKLPLGTDSQETPAQRQETKELMAYIDLDNPR